MIATLIGILIGAPFRRCLAEEGREHGPPYVTASTESGNAASLQNAALGLTLTASALRIPSIAQPTVLNIVPRGVELRHAFVLRTVTHSIWGAREHYTFASTPAGVTSAPDLEERQRRQVAIHLGQAVSQHGDAATVTRIEGIYTSLQLAHWGRHADGLLGGHFNFDYSAVHCVDLDRRLPHARYGSFASLHFHHDQERVHVDVANPFGLAGALIPVHFFLDVVAGHIPWHRRPEVHEITLAAPVARALSR